MMRKIIRKGWKFIRKQWFRGKRFLTAYFRPLIYGLVLVWCILLLFIGLRADPADPGTEMNIQVLTAIAVPVALLVGFELSYHNNQRGLFYQKMVEVVMECASLLAQIANLKHHDELKLTELQERINDIQYSSKYFIISHWARQMLGTEGRFQDGILEIEFLLEKKKISQAAELALHLSGELGGSLEPVLKSLT